MADSELFDELVAVVDATATSPVILHAPHGGRVVPAAFRPAFTITDAALAREHDALVDHFTDRVVVAAIGADASELESFGAVGAARSIRLPMASAVINGLSRFVVDVERFDDESEEKIAVGQGVLYSHGAWRDPIRVVPRADVESLMEFYRAYSAAIERLVDAALAHHGRAVMLEVRRDTYMDEVRVEPWAGGIARLADRVRVLARTAGSLE
ncbi:N-formylglutamate amidohydrolase [Agromyces sp. MMS24-JH15]|uniref:N-formylglutamate amidohydrolase n=1 Tax=Agromyces sp. MMS24-JH15 TaxID=3243765 RepID=UPI003748CCB4